ncbi:D-glycero-alpha-D-manno-heptose-1,7-bisphosphate 7-phosphatase [Dyadobacter jiangsuensis]|uniref:D,D-heptose 1,7-bisphosphate phosphatase n=1 Tax=Dyadobacter jiangsuensis TaxID=1591085 RepID=A0A2P8G5K7_9BACT|nr:HAD family hydrolase [Dyadobacter jiangsuensis]PSL29249.1 D-alpha,beta-D-heptose 1,7-bisphosphate phosphatase [Dyadobacter jiangsuensis]
MALHQNKCVFLDRDGVLNEDCPDYLYKLEELVIPEGVAEALQILKEAGYLLIVITNQAGIAKGLYTADNVYAIHEAMQNASDNALDDLYFSPYHPSYSGNSLSRKPGSLLIEKAMAKYDIDPAQSWMIGDRDRDMEAGKNVGLKTVHIIPNAEESTGDYAAVNLLEAARLILKQ